MEDQQNNLELKREWHANFVSYTEFIVSHSNYKGLYFERGKDNKVKWVVTGISDKGKKRRDWWDEQCLRNGINIEAGCYAKIALKIHPTKKHICQICGTALSIEYVYPNKRTLAQINNHFGTSLTPFSKDVFEIIDELLTDANSLIKFLAIFKIENQTFSNKNQFKEFIKSNYVDSFAKGFLSPGAMSNSPDRLDGYHSDGACCRHESDKGRHKSNLQRYGQDRRVYENWADGNWKMADRLMSLFRQHEISADHIGPISLGFCHRPKFHPLTHSENSAKNNRMSLNDVQVLIEDEKVEQVVSWHSKFIWDKLKSKVKTDRDAVRLSDLMRKNLHHVLIILSIIDEAGYGSFLLRFLNPEYSFFDYKFEGFDPSTGLYKSFETKNLTGKNQQNNIERYRRVAFEKLQEYREVSNRKTNMWDSPEIDANILTLLELIKSKKEDDAIQYLDSILEKLASSAESKW
jgi:Alw26I/Eco31I/Esp3I family type II restriction endonuclease